MKLNQLATLILRLMGIYCLIQVIPVISVVSHPILVGQPVRPHDDNVAIVALAALLLFACRLVVGILLLVRSVPWGERLAGHSISEETVTAASFEQVQVFIFAIAGVFIFSAALPQLFKSIFNLAQSLTDNSVYWASRWREGAIAMGTLVEAALGLALFFRARWFIDFWRSLQTVEPTEPPQAEQ